MFHFISMLPMLSIDFPKIYVSNNSLNSSTEAVVQMCSVKKLFLEILQNSQENTCARVSFLIKLQAVKEHLWWLFLFLEISLNSQEHTWARVSFLIKLQAGLQLYLKSWMQACNFIEKETLAQVLICEFCEIS